MKRLPIVVLALMVVATMTACPPPLETSWTEATLQGTWTNQPTHWAVAYGQDSMNQVHIRGTAYNSSPSTSSTVFTLPAGLRPASMLAVPVTINGGAAGNVYIYSNGTVVGNASVAIQWLYFGEIVFSPN